MCTSEPVSFCGNIHCTPHIFTLSPGPDGGDLPPLHTPGCDALCPAHCLTPDPHVRLRGHFRLPVQIHRPSQDRMIY